MSAAPPVLSLEGVVGGYDGRPVLHGVDLTVPSGGAVCLVGPNGSGKSTLLNAILGLCEVSAGRIVVQGQDIAGIPAARRMQALGLACVPQESSVFPALTVEQNLRLGLYHAPRAAQAKAEAARLLDQYPALGRRRHELAHVLSGGERRLLEVVRAMMTNPAVLLVDEPSIGLDTTATETVFSLFASMRRDRGIAVLVAEQNLRAGLGFAETGCVLVSGRIVATMPSSELLAGSALRRYFLERPV